MSNNAEQPKLSISFINDWIGNKPVAVKLAILSVFFMVTLFGIVSYTVLTLNQQSSDGTVIDIAGRQRMLTQKFTKEIFDELNDRQIVALSAKETKAIATQIMADRAYYNKNVIVKLKQDGMAVTATPNFHNTVGAIPPPATFVQGVSSDLLLFA